MGKRSLSGKKSLPSTSSKSKITKMNRKFITNKKKAKRNIRKNRKESIRQLFSKLSQNSNITINSRCSQNSSVDETVIWSDVYQNQNTNNSPTKHPSEPIVIDDDSFTSDGIHTPFKPSSITSSTPIPKSNNAKNKLDNMVPSMNRTKEINPDSFITIDLTIDSEAKNNSVIQVADTTVTKISCNSSLGNLSSMSGDSQITVYNQLFNKELTSRRLNKNTGMSNMDLLQKKSVMDMVSNKYFNPYSIPKQLHSTYLQNQLNSFPINESTPEAKAEIELKKRILNVSVSRNSVGSNIYNPTRKTNEQKTGLRMIIIDGSNVAMGHGKRKIFSVEGLKICIDYFVKRGHEVKAFVPEYRNKNGKSSNPRLLNMLEQQGLVVYTPSREIQGRHVTSYDDRYIVQCAAEFEGVIVSRDHYRDLIMENPKWRFVIENRLLIFTWVGDMLMFPKDPLGRNGPTLQEFLMHPPSHSNSANVS